MGGLLSYFYDSIASAKLCEEELTFDLSVPDNVTYMANGFISHNTIGLLMDCDTTGIEPDLALKKVKKLVGGGTMSIVNQTVPRALRKLGYNDEQIVDIIAYIDENSHVIEAPHLQEEHMDVFDTAMGERSISYLGHLKMMAAAQPFLSGAISKTVNVPEDFSVEDVERVYVEGWRLGIKALALYRDNCKVGQPLSVSKKVDSKTPVVSSPEPVRRRLPKKRAGRTFKFRVADTEGYLTTGEFPDGTVGEIFLKVAKQGSTLAGIMDAFAISISMGLQYGVPLSAYVKQFVNTRFEPSGMTDDPDFRIATSILDYVFRLLALDYLNAEDRHRLNIRTAGERQGEIESKLSGDSGNGSVAVIGLLQLFGGFGLVRVPIPVVLFFVNISVPAPVFANGTMALLHGVPADEPAGAARGRRPAVAQARSGGGARNPERHAPGMSIIGQVVTEATVLTGLAGYLGLVAAVGVVEATARLMAGLPAGQGPTFFGRPDVDLQIALLAAGLLTAAGAVAGLAPARSAVSIRPVEALAHE